ncbi:RAD55 family ATPase [Vulcanisaeta thermophila]|uniref:RAD55 family ATPase n=1 Tax=Vulcanisaeta thermophila TaxID=867917 RepID=UPI000853981B|nr:RAD55 family ATPase [Vulcanisaeta thermophila]
MEFLKCEVLNEILPTGLPYGYLVLINGDIGMGKTLLVKIIAKSAIQRGDSVLYVAFDDDPAAIMEDLGTNNVFIIDGFNLSDRYRVKNPNIVDYITDLEPSQFIGKINNAVQGRSIKVLVVDSLNDLIVNVEPRALLILLKQLKALSRRYGLLTLTVAHTTTEDVSNLMSNLEYVFDGVIEMEFDENMANLGIPIRRMRIKRMRGIAHSLNWFYFTTSRGNIVPVDVNEVRNMLKSVLESMGVQLK